MVQPAEDQTLGQYVIDEKIAQGGMAEIFKGRALEPGGLERPVVIKRILPHIAADAEFVEMLVNEAKLAVQLSHGNIAQVFDLGRLGNDYFMVMEYVEGESLSRIARHFRQTGEKIPVPIVLFIASEIAGGLDYMHQKTDPQGNPLHIVHRDISPQNIIISWSGTVKIIDFGIAKTETHISTTDSGVVKGKFAYMSPEHVNGERLDRRTDIFSLCVILWELLTNQRLFKGKNNRETISRVKRCRIPSSAGYRDDIPKEIDQILKKGLAKNRKNRFASAHDLQLGLIRALVQHYPHFAPKDLQDYLRAIFEYRIVEEPTIVGETYPEEVPTLITQQMEATALADPRVLKKRLKELETYDLGLEKGKEEKITPPEEVQEIALRLSPLKSFAQVFLSGLKKIPWKKILSALPIKRLIQWTLIAVLLSGLIYGGFWAYPHLKEFFKTAPKPSEMKPIPKPEKVAPALTPQAPIIQYGIIRITSKPPGAKIFLNDRDTGLTTPAELKELESNLIYRIGLFLSSYQYWEGKAQVTADETTEIQADLKLNFGSLRIISYPPGATAFINGENRGPTPLTLKELRPGSIYEIQVKLPGHVPWQQRVKVFGGKMSIIRAVLKKQ